MRIKDILKKQADKELQKKYVEILEQEESSLKLVKHFQERCQVLSGEKRELKKELALANETINELNESLLKADKQIGKLKKKIEESKCKGEKII
ncbi:MAG: hypothetical protein HFH45_03460 [Bacilli bacterium]|nr:hypothetical protein [Bacilli bacterium]